MSEPFDASEYNKAVLAVLEAADAYIESRNWDDSISAASQLERIDNANAGLLKAVLEWRLERPTLVAKQYHGPGDAMAADVHVSVGGHLIGKLKVGELKFYSVREGNVYELSDGTQYTALPGQGELPTQQERDLRKYVGHEDAVTSDVHPCTCPLCVNGKVWRSGWQTCVECGGTGRTTG